LLDKRRPRGVLRESPGGGASYRDPQLGPEYPGAEDSLDGDITVLGKSLDPFEDAFKLYLEQRAQAVNAACTARRPRPISATHETGMSTITTKPRAKAGLRTPRP